MGQTYGKELLDVATYGAKQARALAEARSDQVVSEKQLTQTTRDAIAALRQRRLIEPEVLLRAGTPKAEAWVAAARTEAEKARAAMELERQIHLAGLSRREYEVLQARRVIPGSTNAAMERLLQQILGQLEGRAPVSIQAGTVVASEADLDSLMENLFARARNRGYV